MWALRTFDGRKEIGLALNDQSGWGCVNHKVCIVLIYCIVLYCIVLYCIVLMYIIQYCSVLYCIVLMYCICVLYSYHFFENL